MTDLPDGSCISLQRQPCDGPRAWFGRLQIGWGCFPVYQRHGSNPSALVLLLKEMWLADLAKGEELEQERQK
jgi:hypothetical protein